MSSDPLTEEMLLSLLADAPEEYLSAEALCGKLGLPQTVVFRQIERLRSLGYRIDVRPALGYRLVEVPDRLTSLELSPLLGTNELGRVIHSHEEIDSTNDEARRLADDGAGHGEVVVAEAQRGGRGRRGRSWLSAPGSDLTFSVVLRPDLPPARAHEVTFASAVALATVLREAKFDVRIKWPNDLTIGDRKAGGILTESAVDSGNLRYVILGVGLNVNAESLPASLTATGTSLRIERGEPLPRALLLAALLDSIEGWLDRLVLEGPGEILARYRDWSATLGRGVRIEGPTPIEGIAQALDEAGALIVHDALGGIHRVTAGDVGLV